MQSTYTQLVVPPFFTIEYYSCSRAFKGELGRYMFRVASGTNQVNYDQKCYKWVKNERTNIAQINLLNSATLTCPCGLHLASLDYRWTQDMNQFNIGRYCFYERTPSTQATQVPLLHCLMFQLFGNLSGFDRLHAMILVKCICDS